jgi:hypothetical protein
MVWIFQAESYYTYKQFDSGSSMYGLEFSGDSYFFT